MYNKVYDIAGNNMLYSIMPLRGFSNNKMLYDTIYNYLI